MAADDSVGLVYEQPPKRIYITPNAKPSEPPPGFTLDQEAPAAPPAGFVLDGIPEPETYEAPIKAIGGAIADAVKKPGQIMTPNPYPEGSEEHQFFEDSRSKGIAEAAPELAMNALGTGGVVGARAKAGEVMLGAGPVRRTTPVTAPPPPTGYVLDGTAQALADDLHAIRQSSVADRAEVGNTIRALPEEAKNPAIGEKLYHAAEDPAEYAKLTPEEKAISDQHLDPLRQEQFDLALEAKKLGGDDLVDDPNFMHRIAKGHAPTYDSISGNAYDPVTGTRGLPRTTSALQERKFYAIESPSGVRKVITPNDNGFSVWNNKVKTDVPSTAEIKPGEVIDVNGQPWGVTHARTKEIEQHGQFAGNKPAEYHKNAFVNTADAVVHLREVVRNLKFVEEVKKSQWWLNHAVRKGGNQQAPKGWREPLMPQFKGWEVDPKIADVLDDFYQPGLHDFAPGGALHGLRAINQFATSSMFWSPIGHMQNVGVHWTVARGWDWLRPGPMRHFATDMTRAIKAVVTQNKDYQRFLKAGGGLVHGGVKNADFCGELGRHMGMQIEKNWSQYKPLFNKIGLKHPYEAVAWWYGKMRNVLWQSSDMFMIHRYLELERKGYSTARAIKDAEKHIPNYRIPTTVIGSRGLSKVLQEPGLTNFARYHYGMWNSFMHMATDLAKGTKAEKKEALGNVAALAFMGYVAYDVMDAIYQKITGDPNAKLLRRGAMSVPHGLAEMSRGEESFSQFLGSNITMAPAVKEILQQFFGKDFFTGKELGGAVPRVEHGAEAMVSPYGTAAQLYRGGEGSRGFGRTAADTVVGGQNTSEKTFKGKQYGKMLREKAAARHEEKPQGPLEGAYYGAKKVLGFSDGPLGPKNEHRYEKSTGTPAEPKKKRSHHNKEKGY